MRITPMNYKQIVVLLMLFVTPIFAQGQMSELKRVTIKKQSTNYRSSITVGNRLYALTDRARLVVWDLNVMNIIHFPGGGRLRFSAIGKDQQDQVYVAALNGNIYKIEASKLSISLFQENKHRVNAICFNSKNELFLITNDAVFDPVRKRQWTDFFHEAVDGMAVLRNNKIATNYFNIPSIVFMDSSDKIWMASSFGEFGGSLQIFDTRKLEIKDSKIEGIELGLFFPKSIFPDSRGRLYMTSGLQHFSNFGEIYKMSANMVATLMYTSGIYRHADRSEKPEDELFIGPGAYNDSDSSIDFATNKGFYKARLIEGEDKLKPEFLFDLKLRWSRESMAIGASMAVLQTEFITGNRLLFLTANDGFGLYDGKSLIFFK